MLKLAGRALVFDCQVVVHLRLPHTLRMSAGRHRTEQRMPSVHRRASARCSLLRCQHAMSCDPTGVSQQRPAHRADVLLMHRSCCCSSPGAYHGSAAVRLAERAHAQRRAHGRQVVCLGRTLPGWSVSTGKASFTCATHAACHLAGSHTEQRMPFQSIVPPLRLVPSRNVSMSCHGTRQKSVSGRQRTGQVCCACSAHAAAARRARLTAQQQSVLLSGRTPSGALMAGELIVLVAIFLGRAFRLHSSITCATHAACHLAGSLTEQRMPFQSIVPPLRLVPSRNVSMSCHGTRQKSVSGR